MKALLSGVIGFAASCYYSQEPTSCAPRKNAFSPEFRKFKLINFYDESYNTRVFRFALPEADMPLNLEVASCITARFFDKDGNAVIRPYTPISAADQRGYFELVVKKYNNAKMGGHLFSLKKGDTMEFNGPWLKIPIKANQYKQIGMIAGGTGIAPLYQVARNVLATPKNKTAISMIYANTRKEDVLLGNELNELMETHPLFSPYYVLTKPPSDWMGGVGYVNKEMIKSVMPPPSSAADSIILVCGPPPFMEAVSGDKDFKSNPPAQGELKGLLKELGYMPKMVFKF